MGICDRLLWIADAPVPSNLQQAVAGHWDLAPHRREHPLRQQMDDAAVAVFYPNGQSGDPRALLGMLSELEHSNAVGLFLLDPGATLAWKLLGDRAGPFVLAAADASADELAARLETASRLQPTIRDLRGELHASSACREDDHRLDDLTEDLRLAARLQRDFLPRRLPEIGPVRFSVLYRPASWVSGDIYDITRLDETHVGFYVADAVGHGLAAALLTMFIKKALQTKRISGNTYRIIPPDLSLNELNADICGQNLSSCQFCTAVYAVLNTQTLELTCARAGHPEPVILRGDRTVERIESPGALLGIFPEETYQTQTVQLQTGDRLVLYTDGIEPAFRDADGEERDKVANGLSRWSGAARDEMILQIADRLDTLYAAKAEFDDVTVLAVDILRPGVED